jgi:hypothetical protein
MTRCTHCGSEYDEDNEGTTHDAVCECVYCDPNHWEFDPDGYPVLDHVDKHGFVSFCGMECESRFIIDN